MSLGPNPDTFVGTSRGDYAPSLTNFLSVLWRRAWAILLVTTVLVGSVVAFGLLQTPVYAASIKILVGKEQATDGPTNFGSDVQGLQQFTKTAVELVGTRPVAEATIERLGLQTTREEFLENLRVEQIAPTQTIEVSYEDPDPERAQQIVNTVGEVFSERVSEEGPNADAINATVWEQAVAPDSPVSPNLLRDGLLALILGSMLGVGLALFLEYLDVRWRSPEEVEQVSGVPTFGVIRTFEAQRSRTKSKKEKEEI